MATLNLRTLLPSPPPAPKVDAAARRALAFEAYERLLAASCFGRVSTGQMGRVAGTTWSEVHAMADAGLIRYIEDSPLANTDRTVVFYFVPLA